MLLLLKGVTVLLLTAFTACDILPTNSDFTEECQDVTTYLNSVVDLTACAITSDPGQTNLRSTGNAFLNLNVNLVSTMVKKINNYSSISFSVRNLEVHIFMVGPYISLTQIPTLITSYASLDIDLIGISQETNGLAAVVFLSYNNMTDIFIPEFFDTSIKSEKTLMSAVVSFSLPQTTNTWILEQIDFTLKHTKELDPGAILSCMNWDTDYWPSCFVSQTNSTHTVCSCYYGTTFALISETDPCKSDQTEYCEEFFLIRMLYYIFTINQLPQETVENYLTITMNLTEYAMKQSVSYFYGDLLLYVNGKLVSKLVKEIHTNSSISISLQTLEVQVFMVGPDTNLIETPTLTTSHASLDIDLIGISKEYAGSASVAFIGYTNIADILKPTFSDDITSKKTIISTVVSTISPQTPNLYLTKPVNFTLKHINGINTDSDGILSCAYLDWYMWDTGLCTITHTNRTHTVCSCSYCPETLALFLLTIPCRDNITAQCAKSFLGQLQYNIDQNCPPELGERYWNIIRNLTTRVKDLVSEQNDLISFGNTILEVSEKLISTLVQKTNTNITLQNAEVQIFMVGPDDRTIRTLSTSHVSLDIDLFEISENIQDSSSVSFVSYNNMSDILKPTFFKTLIKTKKTMMSSVVSVSLPQNEMKTPLTKPVNITFKHINAIEPEFSLSCVSWKKTEWVKDGCDIIQTNSSHTVCSCNHLNTFALIMETNPCRGNFTEPCLNNFLNQIQYSTTEELPQETVKYYMSITVNLMTHVKNNSTDTDKLMKYGNVVLDVLEKLASTLVTKSDTCNNITISLQNLEVQVNNAVGPNPSFNNSSTQLRTSNAVLDIDLIGLSKNNKGSAAVAFMSYTDMTNILTPSFFNKAAKTRKIMMSTVVSTTLPKTTHTWFTQPVNITFKHINKLDPEGRISCVYWMKTEWVEGGCDMQTNSTHTVCSCDHLSVFALIMETLPCKTIFGATVSLHCNVVLNMSMAQGVGIVFLTLCLLTFSFCCQNANETNTALMYLCLNLLLFHLINLLKPLFQSHLQPLQACAVVNGIQWFFFISAFLWMFIETVFLFLFIKKVSKIRSNQQERLVNWKWLNITGYLIALVVVIVCAVLDPTKSNKECSGFNDIDMIFDIPVLFTVASNMILYIIIIIMIIFTLKHLKNENVRRNTDNTDIIIRVMFKSLAQFIILGCYWILLYIPSDNGVLYNVFLFLNSQQGTFIFIVHCLFKQEVRKQYIKFLCRICCFKIPGTTTQVEVTQETQH